MLESAGKLLISVVRRGRGDRVVAIAKEAGARGSTVLMGRGAANSRLMQIFGLEDTEKEIVFTIAPSAEMPPIVQALRYAPDLCVKMPGIGIILDVNVLPQTRGGIKATDEARAAQKDARVEEEKVRNHELICVIVNAGFAEDIMQAARKAGATGGTILKARGTGREEDKSFFGITIVPEKDMLLILTLRKETDRILQAIRDCPCLAEPGIGIVFSMPVEKFFQLGLKNNPD